MKHIHTILLVSIFSICYSTAQRNTLTYDELYGIKFNNVTLGQIETTEANTAQMQTLFGGTLSSEMNETSPSLAKDFSNSAITLGFEDDNDTGDSYYLAYMSVLDESMEVTIGLVYET